MTISITVTDTMAISIDALKHRLSPVLMKVLVQPR